MSLINLHARHNMDHDEAQHAADELAADLAKRFDIDYGWEGDVIHFERPGVHGQILVQNSTIEINAQLGFLLMFLKPRIEEEVIRYLREEFDCSFDD